MKNIKQTILIAFLTLLIGLVLSVGVSAAEYLPGDVNDDGKVSLVDSVLTMRYIVGGYDVDINLSAADSNGDGLVNTLDAVTSARHLSGGHGVTLPTLPYAEGLTYQLLDDGTFYTVTGIGTCTATEFAIPMTHNGLPVKEIAYFAFVNCTNLTKVEIPSSVTSIGGWAFDDCTGLTSVVIGNGVTSIGDYAFSDCYELTSITIPDGVTSIGNHAFSDCTNLIQVVEGVHYVDTWVVDADSEIQEANLRANTVGIADYAFWQYYNSSLTSVTIPNGVKTIGNSAFYSCSELTSITIPSSVTRIGDDAFYSCSALTSIVVDENNLVYHSGSNCLIGTATGTLLKGCDTSVIPDDGSVTSIGEWAFSYCTGLTSITIPDSVTSIGDYAFSDCYELTSITIPDSVTSIGDDAFSYCYELTSITIPDSVTSIGEEAFCDCTGLTDVYYTGTEEEWKTIAIDGGNGYLENATIHYNYVPA